MWRMSCSSVEVALQMGRPLAVIGGHRKAVSYVRFMGRDRLVSASTDNTLKLWDINAASSGSNQPLMTYTGNTQNSLSCCEFHWQCYHACCDSQGTV